MRLDTHANASRRVDEFVKENLIKHQGLFEKALDVLFFYAWKNLMFWIIRTEYSFVFRNFCIRH